MLESVSAQLNCCEVDSITGTYAAGYCERESGKKPERLRPLYTEEGISHAIAETHVRRRNPDVREILEKILIHHS